MDKELFDYVKERVNILAESQSSKQETKDAALAWKSAVSAGAESPDAQTATEKLLDFLEGRPSTIDNVIAFAQGPAAEFLGKEVADAMLAKQLKRKEEGAKYCDCASCAAASELLAKFGRIEL